MRDINGKTRLTGLIGYPLEHSLSPLMHNAAYEKLNLNYCYIPLEIKESGLKTLLTSIRYLNFAGVNVTIPYKEKVIPLLDEITDSARLIGAINTIQNLNGKLIGHNTDGPGFLDSLRYDAGFDPAGKNMILLGAGGASRAVASTLCQAGIKTISICETDFAKGKKLVEYLGKTFKKTIDFIEPESPGLRKKISSCHLLVNATPIGMYPMINDSPLSSEIILPKHILVYDLVYNPQDTALLKRAKKAGAKTASGLGMLIRQGALSFQIFTGIEAPYELMKKKVVETFKS
ncbi:MAG: shikimate dehydrogenase [bacterium]